MTSENVSEKRILWIDVVRCLLLLWIVAFWHLQEYTQIRFTDRINYFAIQTTYGVLACFFILSGYFAGKHRICSMVDSLYFYKRKAARIYPLFIFSLLLFYICRYIDAESFICSALGFGIIMHTPATLWFVCCLFFYFLVTPIILKIHHTIVAIAAGGIISILFLSFHMILNADIRLFYYWFFFFGGLFIGKGEINIAEKYSWLYETIALAIYVLFASKMDASYSMSSFIGNLAFVLFILCLVYRNNRYKTHSDRKIIDIISYSGMAIYMFHRPVFYVMEQLFGKFSLAFAYLVCVPLVIISGWIIQSVYDKGCQYLLSRYSFFNKKGS